MLQKLCAGIWHRTQTIAGHLKNTDFTGGSEAVFDRSQNPVATIGIALKIQDTIHQMLEHPWTRDISVFGHVAD